MKIRILTSAFLMLVIVAKAQLPTATEYQALMDLYSSTNGGNWTNKSGWSTANPAVVQSIVGWYGVTTDASGHVMELNLNNNNLSGSIPLSFGNLSGLKKLYLSGNSLSGSIPSTLGGMSGLVILHLGNNQLSGPIPSTLGGLTNLNQLVLGINQLTGPIPGTLGQLSNLHTLNLRHNLLTAIPVEIGSAHNLVEAILDNNRLAGSIPAELGNLLNLQVLDLNGNLLTGHIPTEFGALSNLLTLVLSNNKLSGTIPTTFGNLTSLNSLALNVNELTGSIPSTLGQLTHLQHLNLRYNKLSGTLPSTLGGLQSLVHLSLDNNNFEGGLPTQLGDIPSLQDVYLHGNNLSGLLPAGFSTLAQLNISHNKFSFADFLAVKQTFTGQSIVYAPQKPIDQQKVLNVSIGSPVVLTTTLDRSVTPSSTYRWFQKHAAGDIALNAASTIGHTVTLPAMTSQDAGKKFYYTISHSNAPGLTLISNEQTLAAIVCSTPSISFETENLNGSHSFIPATSGAEQYTVAYNWDFGDGTSSADQNASHNYTSTGDFVVTVTITYSGGDCPAGVATSSQTITIENSFCGSIYCDGAGNVGIGTQQTNGFRLSVNGKIRANDIIKVYPQNQWSDFVFEKDYKLRPLNEVEKFIKENGHLPEIPSAKEVETNGIDLGGMDAKLLQKIEEMTLYMIELKKENDALKKRIQKLELKK